ncbi:MAG: hypothetical protein H0T46_09880 [Deltaproteobacteria bacterium]|nr:hypothetical protein [Deltaproteobacteria bacterium]
MSDKQKGNRDISDLKARLGLKKGAAAPTTGQTRANGGSGGVMAPPGVNLPPPPGMQPQHPPQPQMPNAADDPFGAMNAMAAVGTVQRAPEIVIVNDGKPVENVGHQSMGRKVATMAIPGVIALIIGIAIGKVGQGASIYNASLSDVKMVLGDKGTPSTVAALKQQLSALDTELDEAKSKNSFRPDPSLDAKLTKAYKELEVKSEIVWRAKQNAMDSEVSAQILSFYAGITELRSMMDLHVKAAKFDDLLYKKNKEKQDAATIKEGENAPLAGQIRYAVLMQAPTETDRVDFGAKIVEIVALVCNGKVANGGRCPEGESPSGFQYRTEPGGPVTEGDIATGGTENVPTKKIVMLLPGGVRDALLKTADGVASEALYQRRLRMIYERIHGTDKVKGLLDEGNKLESRLQTESNKSTRFSFFM